MLIRRHLTPPLSAGLTVCAGSLMRYDALVERQRAPHRVGHRTTLKIPSDVLAAANELAKELGTTTNDAIVRLAEDGAAVRRRRLEAEQLSEKRRAAIARAARSVTVDYPDDDAMQAAMLSGREEP